MGWVKHMWMDAQERGWNSLEGKACESCVNQKDIWRLSHSCIENGQCDYCEKPDTAVLAVDKVQEHLYEVLDAYYAEPANAGTPWVDGEWIVELIDTDDVLQDLGFYPNDALRAEIIDADLTEQWVRAARGHWADIQDEEVMLYSWDSFCQATKHQTRFNFRSVRHEAYEQEVPVADMLDVVGNAVSALIKTLPDGTELYRARYLPAAELAQVSASTMGPPPKEVASAGRMNPAGIPYFYAAFDVSTALAEIGPAPEGKLPAAAIFHNSKPLKVVDFCELPDVPSVFATDQRAERVTARFLQGFVSAITRRVEKDGREHIDYVPSQIVCEYLAQSYTPEGDEAIDGILFPSAVHEGGRNLVVFPSGKYFQTDRFKALSFVGAAQV
ncbi:HEPN-associated N-terminal domain-containing protein [Stenotrophomonas sp. PFBMAA-4]|uniref:HEPN-associated N-terminal domain-containing protein n=1 Tax=Stenotrophomonas sp. PFBMAA-4 TaxID=3043301 RepID=UPI0024B52A57|nr:HEPN-associated N-terminal domain-containing protein [Stenotrophomonas sp. PFBMAA-4]MDI9271790.1 RES domain-containing protein [Stenotrophomonas sp. PFBMAA-4]